MSSGALVPLGRPRLALELAEGRGPAARARAVLATALSGRDPTLAAVGTDRELLTSRVNFILKKTSIKETNAKCLSILHSELPWK